MSYLAPSEFVPKLIDAGEAKIMMSTKDTLIRAFMAGASRCPARSCFPSASACYTCSDTIC